MLLIASVRSKQIFTETILPSIFGDKDYCLDNDNTSTSDISSIIQQYLPLPVGKFSVIFHVTSSKFHKKSSYSKAFY